MKAAMFTSWQVRCGIADYAAQLVQALQAFDDTEVDIVPFDRKAHPRRDYVAWGRLMNAGDVAHIQHEYTFFGYLLPWRNHFRSFTRQIHRPLVITKHVSFDGPLVLDKVGLTSLIQQTKWAMYNRWLGPYATYLNRDTFDIAQQIIVLSISLKEQLVARGIHPNKINVIPPGVSSAPPAAGGDKLTAEWGWEHKHIIGLFGFITPAKGHLIALDALAQLPADYVLLIAGGLRREQDRSALEAIQKRIAILGLQERVRITGYLDAKAIPSHISACDVLIYPYTRVDFSYSVMTGIAYEAALAVPVIISDVAAHRELAASSGSVELVRSGDATHLAHTIQQVMGNPAQRDMLRQAAQRFARENSWMAVAHRTREVYLKAATLGQAKVDFHGDQLCD